VRRPDGGEDWPFGKFLACSNYRDARTPKKILVNGEGKLEIAQDEVSSELCDKCGAPMFVKTGRFGKFLACSQYPGCKNTKRIGGEGQAKAEPSQTSQTGEDCEKCGSPLVYRKGRFGPFIACSNYPRCRNTKKIAPAVKEGEGAEAAKAAEPVNPVEQGQAGEKKARKRSEEGSRMK